MKGWTLTVWLTVIEEDRQDQDICETDGFLLQPLHIFINFFELYEKVFHKPGEEKRTLATTLEELLLHTKTVIQSVRLKKTHIRDV